MPRRSGENLSDLPADYIDIAGRLAMELTAERENLTLHKEPVVGTQKDRLGVMADKLIVITAKGLGAGERREHLPLGYIVDELIYLSKGYSEQERADIQNIKVKSVKSRLKRIKVVLGTSTRLETIAEGIQRGFIPIQIEDQSLKPLSWMEKHVLSYSASGWTAVQISEHFDISPRTVDSYYEGIRAKLDVSNMSHAVRRAFELGIFKVGENIKEAGELDLQMRVEVLAAEKKPALLVKDHRKIELLRIMAEQKSGWISAEEALKAGFYPGVADIGRRSQFGRMMLYIAKDLSAIAGQPLVGRKKVRIDSRRTDIYFLKAELVVEIDGEKHIIPRYPQESSKTKLDERLKTGGQKSKKPRPRKKTKVRPPKKKTTPKPVPAPKPKPARPLEADVVLKPTEDFFEAVDLPPLDEVLLSSLSPRETSEVLENIAVKNAVEYVGRQHLAIDYRTKVVLALRYGLRPDLVNLAFINRKGENFKLPDISRYVPAYQGLDLNSAFMVSGLTPFELLQAESRFIKDFKGKFPALAELEPKIEEQLKRLGRAADKQK